MARSFTVHLHGARETGMRTGVALWVFALALSALSPVAARAQNYDDWRSPSSGSSAEPLDRILPEIRRSHPGRFYDAEGPFVGGDGQMHYRVKWMKPDGRVVWFDANARTGQVLGTGAGRFGGPGYGYGGGDEQSRERSDERNNWRGDEHN